MASEANHGRLMLAFTGTAVPPRLGERLATAPAAGVTLFRASDVLGPGQVPRLTTARELRDPGGRCEVADRAAHREHAAGQPAIPARLLRVPAPPEPEPAGR